MCIYWSSNSFTLIDGGGYLIYGSWAGHCFDIVDITETAEMISWKDVTDEAIQEIRNLWSDEGSECFRSNIPRLQFPNFPRKGGIKKQRSHAPFSKSGVDRVKKLERMLEEVKGMQEEIESELLNRKVARKSPSFHD